ncbi:hypothetical protein ISO81_06125 [Morganella morganii subsp. morganii]|uniref:hypothetical protein n=1 Tax=Morganella morganii TaxID=582 RepID=UPI001BDAE334|nr:hypothetical protein [Morganella morganii]MBT0344975.1 hypothetical protein [Morganella morganii subsp. morganii]
MTVSTELSHEEYTGNGVTTDFDFRFRIFEAKHLVVSVADPDGTERILTNGTDYTLRGVGSYRGGKVILKMPLATGWKIGIARDLPAVQETDLRNQGKFFAEVHEDAFDYLTMLIQKSLGYLSLCLRKPSFISDHYDAKGNKISNLGKPVKDDDAVDLGTMKDHISAKDKRSLRVADKDIPALPNVVNRANKLLSFDNNGNPVVIVPESGSAADVLAELGKPGGAGLIGYNGGALTDAIYWVTFEMFGAAGDGVTDDTASINAAIKYLNKYEDGLSAEDVEIIVNSGGGEIRLTPGKVYRYTSTLFIPANIRIEGRKLYFNNKTNSSLYYDGDLNKPAVTTLTYKKRNDGKYYIYNDILTIPDGSEFDNGDYYAACRNIQLNCSLITAPGTPVGVYWIGASGSSTNQMCIGENDTDDARLPDVGLLQACAWGSVHYNPHILARKQGAHFENANGGTLLVAPYIDRNGSFNNDQDSAPFVINGASGTYGVSFKNTTITLQNPIVEHFYNAFVASKSDIRVYSPHIESAGGKLKHCFYLSDESNLLADNVPFTHDTSVSGASVFYLKNQHKQSSSVRIRGMPTYLGYTLVMGEESNDILHVEDISNGQLQYGKIGDSSLVRKIATTINYPQINVSVDGDDKNYGLHTESPVRNIQKALDLAKVYSFSRVIINITGYHNITENISVGIDNVTFSGTGSVNLQGNRINFEEKESYVVRNYVPIFTTGPHALYIGGGVSLDLSTWSEIKGSYATILCQGMNILKLNLADGNYANMSYLVDAAIKPRPAVNLSGLANMEKAKMPTTIGPSGVNTINFISGF